MKAYELLEQNDWCKHAYARDREGKAIHCLSNAACSFCTLGAIRKVYRNNYEHEQAKNKVEKHLFLTTGCLFVDDWNDAPERTKEEVINLLKELDV